MASSSVLKVSYDMLKQHLISTASPRWGVIIISCLSATAIISITAKLNDFTLPPPIGNLISSYRFLFGEQIFQNTLKVASINVPIIVADIFYIYTGFALITLGAIIHEYRRVGERSGNPIYYLPSATDLALVTAIVVFWPILWIKTLEDLSKLHSLSTQSKRHVISFFIYLLAILSMYIALIVALSLI